MTPFDETGNFRMAPQPGRLRGLALWGAGATVTSKFVVFAIHLISTIVLARILVPEEFGLVTMVVTFSALFMNFGTNGFTEAILQKPTIHHSLVSNLFWINASIGLVLTGGFAAGGTILARFYGEPRIAAVAAAIALTIFFTCISVQHLALLKRAMRFPAVALLSIVARIASVILSIALALAGWGHWALVAGLVAQPIVISAGAWLQCRWIPGLPRRDAETWSMVSFAIHTYGRFAANYATRNLDYFFLGWLFGAKPLGFYQKAYDLFVLPANQLSLPLTNVAVSAFSRLRDDIYQYKRQFLNALSTLAFLGMGLGAGLTLTGADLIRVILGPGWEDSGRIFTYFAPGIGIMLLHGTHGWIHLSLSRADRWFRWGILELAVTAILFLLMLPWGGLGLAAAWTGSFWILTFPALGYAGKPIQLGSRAALGAVWKFVVAAAVAGPITALMVRAFALPVMISEALQATCRIAVTSVLFTVLYLGAVILLHRGSDPILRLGRLLQDLVVSRSLQQT